MAGDERLRRIKTDRLDAGVIVRTPALLAQTAQRGQHRRRQRQALFEQAQLAAYQGAEVGGAQRHQHQAARQIGMAVETRHEEAGVSDHHFMQHAGEAFAGVDHALLHGRLQRPHAALRQRDVGNETDIPGHQRHGRQNVQLRHGIVGSVARLVARLLLTQKQLGKQDARHMQRRGEEQIILLQPVMP